MWTKRTQFAHTAVCDVYEKDLRFIQALTQGIVIPVMVQN